MKGKSSLEENDKDKKDANACMAVGAGVGLLGTASATLAGAVCPLCFFIAPGLVGYGAYRRWKLANQRRSETDA